MRELLLHYKCDSRCVCKLLQHPAYWQFIRDPVWLHVVFAKRRQPASCQAV